MTPRQVCNGKSKGHRDAEKLVEFLFGEGGSSPLSNMELAVTLGFTTRRGSIIEVDRGRFYQARNHVKDRIWQDGRPCCGYRLHYREIRGGTHLCLVDETGALGDHALPSINQLLGWLTQLRARQTADLRQIVMLEALASHALRRGDGHGNQICVRAVIELDEFGTIKPTTLGEMTAWAQGLQ